MKTPWKSISMQELVALSERLTDRDCLLDVRSAEEFEESHVKGALNIEYDRVHEDAHRLARYDRVFIYCRSGRRAFEAADILDQLGLKDLWVVDQGGMIDLDDNN